MIHVKQQRESNTVVLELCGAFDGRAVEELVAIALQQPSSSALVIDLSRATDIYDSALGRLSDALPRRRHSVRGLHGRRQPRRLFFEAVEGEGVHAHTD